MSTFLDEMQKSVPALRRYARSLTRNADRADDLVQDCLERAIRKRGLWQPKGTVEAWLFKMLVNLWRNDLRSNRRRGEQVPIDGMPNELSVPAAQPGRIALAEMSRALEAIPAEQREALLLVVVDGRPYEEAAEILSIPIGTLMSRISRARAALRQLTGQGDEPRLRSVK